jgi:hypothetical protein
MSVDDDATLQYYIDKRYKGRSTNSLGNGKRGVEDSDVLTSQNYDSMSVVDLCRIEKKNNLPEIPLLEESIMIGEPSQNHFKCIIFDEIAKASQQSDQGLEFFDGVQCSLESYM